MKIDILTLFPEMCEAPLRESILGKAREKGLIDVRTHALRTWGVGKHKVTDDAPYGGGVGMVMKPEPVYEGLASIRQNSPRSLALLMTPQGKRFTQDDASELAAQDGLIFVCGRYEGYDERIRTMIDREYSLGDFVLTGGELSAMVMIDAIARFVPGVLGNSESAPGDSFSDGLLEYPQYTRPVEYMGLSVPQVLLSGNHAHIETWRRREQLRRTLVRRPDLLEHAELSDKDRRWLQELADEVSQEEP